MDTSFTVKNFEDKIKAMQTEHETMTRVAKDNHYAELRSLDVEKTKREREHLDMAQRK